MLKRRDGMAYGDSQADIREELLQYGRDNGYPPEHFADAVCPCGNADRTFRLQVDDSEGAAVRVCSACGTEHPMGDSADFLEDAELEECGCPCGEDAFEVTAGVALYPGTEDVRWFYLGCRCPECGLTACYGDWKNEFEDYRELLARV